jgi:eukaryotic translation initiation factor 2C
LGRDSIYLNVDVLHKAFPSSISLLDYINEFVGRNRGIPNSLQKYEIRQLKEFLKMLTIGYRVTKNEPIKTYGFNDLIEPQDATFTDDNGRKMSVAQYFQQVRGIRLRYPDLPYLWVGSKTRNVYLPLEFCEIPAGQATNKKCTPACTAGIIKYSATTTDVRKQKIRNLLSKINYDTNPTISGFGIDVDKAFQKIEGRIIDPPELQYKNGKITPQRGAWRDGKYLETSAQPIKWCIINCDSYIKLQEVMELQKSVLGEAKKQQMNLLDFRVEEIVSVTDSRNFRRDMVNALSKCLRDGYRFVMVILNNQPDCYAGVKQAAELEVGILTQCLKSNTIKRMGKGNPAMTINNILHKVNSKLNGKNQEIVETSYNTFNSRNSGVMFIGADVTHPTPDAKNEPSVVGVASSYDDVGFRYCCAWRIQDPRKEMIVDLADIVTEHLQYYLAKNKKLPGKIMYYRDGE